MKEEAHKETNFINLLNQYKALIWKVAGIYCQDSEDRKDLIQEIILQLWSSYPKYDANKSGSTWVYRIALNVSISFLRKGKTRQKIKGASLLEFGSMEEGMDSQRAEQLEQLYEVIGHLKAIEKAVITLHLEGFSNKEIGEVLGLSATNVSTRLSRIREKLKTLIKNK